MKTKIKIVTFFLLLLTATMISPQKASSQVIRVSFQAFYDDLSPYGDWVYRPDYGYVWIPDAGPDFFPYATNGYWVFTDDGWTWVSDYPWGWAPFHYGRWYIDAAYGPMWIPGYEWGPGWVVWRKSRDCYGWAPIGPGVSLTVAYGRGYRVPHDYWRFVYGRDFGRKNIHNYYINPYDNVTIINNSTVINNIYVDNSRHVSYHSGPERAEVERNAGRSFMPVKIKESNKPAQDLTDNQLQLYRPRIEKNAATGKKPAPSKVSELENVRPVAQKTSATPQHKTAQPASVKQPQPQQGVTPAKKAETVNQSQKANQFKKTEGTKQPQQANPSRKTGVEKPSQKAASSKKSDGVKPSQQDNKSAKSDVVKSSDQENPSKKPAGTKQPKQGAQSKKGQSEKQQQHDNPSKK